MYRFISTWAVAGLMTMVAVPALADSPDPGGSHVPRNLVLYQRSDTMVPPNPSIKIYVEGTQGPVNGATVELHISPFADPLICWCAANGNPADAAILPQAHPVISGTTDINGNVSFVVLGGGCVDPARLGNVVVGVFADGILLAEIGINSPDAIDAFGAFPTDPGYVFTADCETGLSDAVFHTGPISTALPEFCTDFNGDGDVGGPDAVLVTPSITTGASCTAGP